MSTRNGRCRLLLNEIFYGKPEEHGGPPRSYPQLIALIEKFVVAEVKGARRKQR